jgi:hypothetical protein
MKAAVRLMLAAALIGAFATTAAAESATARNACIPSVFRLCPTAALTGNREAAKACLLKNLALASPQCQAAVHAEPDDSETARNHIAAPTLSRRGHG